MRKLIETRTWWPLTMASKWQHKNVSCAWFQRLCAARVQTDCRFRRWLSYYRFEWEWRGHSSRWSTVCVAFGQFFHLSRCASLRLHVNVRSIQCHNRCVVNCKNRCTYSSDGSGAAVRCLAVWSLQQNNYFASVCILIFICVCIDCLTRRLLIYSLLLLCACVPLVCLLHVILWLLHCRIALFPGSFFAEWRTTLFSTPKWVQICKKHHATDTVAIV